MNFQFRAATRSEAKPLIGLYAESGCGKTWSSLMLARGFVGPTGRIGMIDTESGRGEAYADLLPGGYDVLPLRNDFSPENYGKAISAAEEAKFDALIVDSGSHEWQAVGGVLDMAAENQKGGKKGPLVWQKPKMEHAKHFMLRLMQTPIPLVILCLRARYPMMEKKDGRGGKDWVKSDVLEPYQSQDILSELFVHGWIDRDHKLHVTKYSRPDLHTIIKDNEPISIATGQALATWAKGGTAPQASTLPASPARAQPAPGAAPSGAGEAGYASIEEEARAAARLGEQTFKVFYRRLNASQRAALQSLSDELRTLMNEATEPA